MDGKLNLRDLSIGFAAEVEEVQTGTGRDQRFQIEETAIPHANRGEANGAFYENVFIFRIETLDPNRRGLRRRSEINRAAIDRLDGVSPTLVSYLGFLSSVGGNLP